MIHFRFRYKRLGFVRWRCRTVHRRNTVLLLPLAPAGRHQASTAAWRRMAPQQLPLPTQPLVLRVGDYEVSQQGDPKLTGHPDIRY